MEIKFIRKEFKINYVVRDVQIQLYVLGRGN